VAAAVPDMEMLELLVVVEDLVVFIIQQHSLLYQVHTQ